MNGTNQEISVVILTHNRRRELLRTVARTVELSERPPIVVVDNASIDGSAVEVRHQFPQVKVVPLTSNLGAAARNIGARNVTTPYVAFCDDDSHWAPGALARAVQILNAHAHIALVTAHVLVGEAHSADPACAVMAASPLPSQGLPGRAVLGFFAGACAMRREVFLESGGYDARFFIGGEEELMALDLVAHGWTLLYAHDVIVHHHPSPHRDPHMRRRLMARNALWVAWRRRAWRGAWHCTGRALLAGLQDPDRMSGFGEALGGLPWALRHRRTVPAHVEVWCQRLEREGGRLPLVGAEVVGRPSLPM
jgi:GT2 family glycosyltransferase